MIKEDYLKIPAETEVEKFLGMILEDCPPFVSNDLIKQFKSAVKEIIMEDLKESYSSLLVEKK